MKTLFNISLKTFLLIIIILLLVNALLLITGGLYTIVASGPGYAYKMNRLTGTTHFLRANREQLVKPPQAYLQEADRIAEEIRQRKTQQDILSPEEWLRRDRAKRK